MMKAITTYIFGFGLSLLFTAAAFGGVWWHLENHHEFPPHEILVPMLIVLALLQLFVQMVCFLHIGREKKQEWTIVALALAFFVMVVVVGGTLWIMHNLAHMQAMSETPAQVMQDEAMTHYMQ
jgi:cytochrome o ubiquinol oxidase operon protein cyoD